MLAASSLEPERSSKRAWDIARGTLTVPAGNVGDGRHYEYPKPIIDDGSSDSVR